MALPQAANVLVDIYRGFNALNPFPDNGAVAAVAGVPGYLKHHLKAGRFGYQALNLYWTHVLYVEDTVDVRDAYANQLGTEAPAAADTITLKDYPVAGFCTAFYVVLVQKRTHQLGVFQEVYLDRLRPRQGPCGVNVAPFLRPKRRHRPARPPRRRPKHFQEADLLHETVAVSCGSCGTMPRRWALSVSGVANGTCTDCSGLNGNWTLTYTSGCTWKSQDTPCQCGTGAAYIWELDYLPGTQVWQLAVTNVTFGGAFVDYTLADSSFHCNGANTLPRTIADNPCTGWPANLTITPL